MLEKQFQANLCDAAKKLGWLYYHTHDSRRSSEGFPDTIMIRDSRLIVAELKVGNRKPTPAQQEWLEAFSRCGVETYLWYPRDWDMMIERLMRR